MGDYVDAAHDDSHIKDPEMSLEEWASQPKWTPPKQAAPAPQPEPQPAAPTEEPSIWGNLQKIWNYQNQPTD